MSTVVDPAAESHPEPAAPSTRDPAGTRATRWVPVAWIAGAVSTGLVVVAALGLSWHRRQLDIAVYLMGARHLLDGHLYLAALPAPPISPSPIRPLPPWCSPP